MIVNRRVPACVLSILVITALTAWAHDVPQMMAHFINVGQGDATLLEFPCGAMLIDAGAESGHEDELIDFLTAFFDRRDDLNNTLESIIITHNHIDHLRVLRRVAEEFTVRRYIDNGITTASRAGNARWIRENSTTDGRDITIREVLDTEITDLPEPTGLTDDTIDPLECEHCDPRIVILSGQQLENPGWTAGDFQNENNHSLVIRVDFGEASFLFTGDLEEAAIETLVDFYADTEMLDADVYQVGHHGSVNGTTPNLVADMTPDIAVFSMGDVSQEASRVPGFNAFSFGHPRREIVEMLRLSLRGRRSHPKEVLIGIKGKQFDLYNVRKRMYATGWDGDVQIRARHEGPSIYRVTTEH